MFELGFLVWSFLALASNKVSCPSDVVMMRVVVSPQKKPFDKIKNRTENTQKQSDSIQQIVIYMIFFGSWNVFSVSRSGAPVQAPSCQRDMRQ